MKAVQLVRSGPASLRRQPESAARASLARPCTARGPHGSVRPAVGLALRPRAKRGQTLRRHYKALAEDATSSVDGDGDDSYRIDFKSVEDGKLTEIIVAAQNEPGLLLNVSATFSVEKIHVHEATINTLDDGLVVDKFIVSRDGKAIPEGEWDTIADAIRGVLESSQQSSKPAIYGQVAAAELQRLRPLQAQDEDSAGSLELAAAELSHAAAQLVAVEKDLIRRRREAEEGGGAEASSDDENAATAKLELARAELAATLERRMAAMEALLAARKNEVKPAEPSKARGGGADLRFEGGGGTGTGPACGSGYEIILQGFNWESCKQQWYKHLKGVAADIAKAGVTAVWFPPPTDSVSPQGYLPRDLYKLDSEYGTEAELREALRAMKDEGLITIADIVINHRCASYQSDDGTWNKFGGRLPWGPEVICNNNPQWKGKGGHKKEGDYSAAPNIDHQQEKVRKDVIEWLNHMKTVGYDGWRFDFVLGYDGKWTREYVDATVPLMAFGEYWDACNYNDGVLDYNQDSHRQRTVDWCDRTGGTSGAFDFTTKGILQEAVQRKEYWRLVDKEGRPPGLVGMWPSRAVTFIENHDTGSTLQHWPFPWDQSMQGYAYILTHPGTPCIFWDHFYGPDSMKKGIRELIAVRKEMGIHSRSRVTVQVAATDVYGATIDGKVAMKIGPGDWSPNKAGVSGTWERASTGHHYAVWKNTDAL